MEHRYRINLKKVFLSDIELNQLNRNIDQSSCQSFSEYARRTLLDPGMNFITIDTNGYQDLVFELKNMSTYFLRLYRWNRAVLRKMLCSPRNPSVFHLIH